MGLRGGVEPICSHKGGGGATLDGSRPSHATLEPEAGFVVATGIECSAPRIAGGRRVDELRKTAHWDRYAEDLAMVADFGIRYVRYGIPFHTVDHDPAARDWAWSDAALQAVRPTSLRYRREDERLPLRTADDPELAA